MEISRSPIKSLATPWKMQTDFCPPIISLNDVKEFPLSALTKISNDKTSHLRYHLFLLGGRIQMSISDKD